MVQLKLQKITLQMQLTLVYMVNMLKVQLQNTHGGAVAHWDPSPRPTYPEAVAIRTSISPARGAVCSGKRRTPRTVVACPYGDVTNLCDHRIPCAEWAADEIFTESRVLCRVCAARAKKWPERAQRGGPLSPHPGPKNL